MRRGLFTWRAVALGLVIAGLLSAPFWGTISSRLTANDNGAAAARLSTSTLAIAMIEHNPLLGVGINNIGVNLTSYAGPGYDGEWLYTVHDKYLLVWAEAGIFALLAFVWFLAATVRRGLRAFAVNDPLLSPIALGLTAGVIGEIAHMGVDLFTSRPQIQLLWIVAAMLAAILAILEREHSLRTGVRGGRRRPRQVIREVVRT
jgi:O-antigen ligase